MSIKLDLLMKKIITLYLIINYPFFYLKENQIIMVINYTTFSQLFNKIKKSE